MSTLPATNWLPVYPRVCGGTVTNLTNGTLYYDVERISRDLENGDDYSDVNRRHNAENEAAGRNIVRERYLMDCGYTLAGALSKIAREEAGDWTCDEAEKTLGNEPAIEAEEADSSNWLIDETGSVIALAWRYGCGSGQHPWHLVNVHSRPGLARGVESHHPTLQSAWIEARAAAFCAGPDLWDEYVPQPGDGKSHWSRLADNSNRLRCVVTPDGVSLLLRAERLGERYSQELDRLHA